MILFSILGATSTISNILVCYATIKSRGFRASNNALKHYIFSLAITDILIGTLCVSLYISLQILSPSSSEIPPTVYNKTVINNGTANVSKTSFNVFNIYRSLNIIEVFLSTCSIFHLCAMAFDRAVSVSRPLFHRAKMTRRMVALKLVCLLWTLSIIPPGITFLSYVLPKYFSNVVPILAVLILLPLVFIIICYSIIFYSIHKRNRQISIRRRQDESGLKNNSFSRITEMRTIKTLLCLVIVFVICWVPLITINIIYPNYTTLQSTGFDLKVALGTGAKLLHYANSACNPCVYVIFYPVYRHEFKVILRKLSCASACCR